MLFRRKSWLGHPRRLCSVSANIQQTTDLNYKKNKIEAIHNKDYSVVKTFKAALPRGSRLRLYLLPLFGRSLPIFLPTILRFPPRTVISKGVQIVLQLELRIYYICERDI